MGLAVHSWKATNTPGNNSCHTPLCSLAYNRDSTKARRVWQGAFKIALDSGKLLAALHVGRPWDAKPGSALSRVGQRP